MKRTTTPSFVYTWELEPAQVETTPQAGRRKRKRAIRPRAPGGFRTIEITEDYGRKL